MIKAILYVPDLPDRQRWITVCWEYAQRHRYEVVGVVANWDDVCRVVNIDRIAEICVIGRRDHLPADRTPRTEVVAETTAPEPERRRPRRVRRQASPAS